MQSLKEVRYLEKWFNLKLEQLLMIAPFKKCNISKKVVTLGMILDDTFILIDQTGTCLYSCDVQITSQHSVTWSYLSAKIKRSHRTEIIVSLLIEKTHDMATNIVIFSTGTSWICSFPATPSRVTPTTNESMFSIYNQLQQPKTQTIEWIKPSEQL